MNPTPFRNLPAVHAVLAHPALQALTPTVAHTMLTAAIREELEVVRANLAHTPVVPPLDTIAAAVVRRTQKHTQPHIREVINATGIVLHTNLGRAPIAEEAAHAAYQAAKGYLNLELDLNTGKRSSRQQPIRDVLTNLLGCESATAVNNCAAATVITLRALAAGKEVIVSRGQLVEIGGSFRIPEIMAVSGAILKEVGTTNITRIGDYANAITPQTGLLLRVHHSNYRISGFTKAAKLEELVALGQQHHIPVVDDIGSGAMFDFAELGLPGDPVVPHSLATGADLVLFSGDKLLGGPQAGLITGKAEYVQRIERDPLMRAFRLDKMTLAALEVTLRLYQHSERARQAIPLLRMLRTPLADLQARAENLAARLLNIPASVRVQEEDAFVGGGSLPDLPLPSVVVRLEPHAMSANTFAERLRLGIPAVLARIQDEGVLFDVRTVFEHQEKTLAQAIHAALV